MDGRHTLVTFRLAEAGEGTRIDFTHEGFPEAEIRDHHNQGWTGSMGRLGRAVS